MQSDRADFSTAKYPSLFEHLFSNEITSDSLRQLEQRANNDKLSAEDKENAVLQFSVMCLQAQKYTEARAALDKVLAIKTSLQDRHAIARKFRTINFDCSFLEFHIYQISISTLDKVESGWLGLIPGLNQTADLNHTFLEDAIDAAHRAGKIEQAASWLIRLHENVNTDQETKSRLARIYLHQRNNTKLAEQLNSLPAKVRNQFTSLTIADLDAKTEESVTYQDYYLKAISLTDKDKRIAALKMLIEDAKCEVDYHLLSAVALCKVDPNEEHFNLLYRIFTQRVRDINKNSSWGFLIAAKTLIDDQNNFVKFNDTYTRERIKNFVMKFLHDSTLAAQHCSLTEIPLHFQQGYFEVLLDRSLRPTTSHAPRDSEVKDCAHLKEQLKNLLKVTPEKTATTFFDIAHVTKVNIAVQLLLKRTTLGRIADIQQGVFLEPRLTAGTKLLAVQFLENHSALLTPENNVLTNDTLIELREELRNISPLTSQSNAASKALLTLGKPRSYLTTQDRPLLSETNKILREYQKHNFNAEEIHISLDEYSNSLYVVHAILACFHESKGEYEKADAEIAKIKYHAHVVSYVSEFFFTLGYMRLAHAAFSIDAYRRTDKHVMSAALAAMHVGDEVAAAKEIAAMPKLTVKETYLVAVHDSEHSRRISEHELEPCVLYKNTHSTTYPPNILKIQEKANELGVTGDMQLEKQYCQALLEMHQENHDVAFNKLREINSIYKKMFVDGLVTAGIEQRIQDTAYYCGLICLALKKYANAHSFFMQAFNQKPANTLTLAQRKRQAELEILQIKALTKMGDAESLRTAEKILETSNYLHDGESDIMSKAYIAEAHGSHKENITYPAHKSLVNLVADVKLAIVNKDYALAAIILTQSKIAPHCMQLNQLPYWLQQEYMDILLDKNCWEKFQDRFAFDIKNLLSPSVLPKAASSKHLKEIKLNIVNMVKHGNLEIGLQALCSKVTFLGKVVEIPRTLAPTSYRDGTYKDLYRELNALLLTSTNSAIKKVTVSEQTRSALLQQIQKDDKFEDWMKLECDAVYQLLQRIKRQRPMTIPGKPPRFHIFTPGVTLDTDNEKRPTNAP